MNSKNYIEPLDALLAANNIPPDLIDAVIDSGFYMRGWVEPFSGRTWQSVSDAMYGNKQFSSSFNIDDFIKYVRGDYAFPALHPFTYYEAKSIDDIQEILSEPRRAHYRTEGSLTFRGQTSEHKYKRRIANPVRADKDGREISILPGLYRQQGDYYSFKSEPQQQRSFTRYLSYLEPNNPEVWIDSSFAYDIMRTEQHYATQTAGLDLAFEIDTAIFFATNKFRWNTAGRAYYESVRRGEHEGLIFCFRFRDPPVKKTQYFIETFDLFKTYPPLRVLRQDCGLPLIGPEERNIALTDIDCIIRLHADFLLPETFRKTPEYMFPDADTDPFYGKLLQLKDRFPRPLEPVVEYEWARRVRQDT